MTQEEKQLLLQDLCARLPYGVKCNAILKQIDGSLKSVFGTFKGYNGWATVGNNLVDIETVKPYLRPMSSMTDEESKEFDVITNGERGFYEDEDGWIRCDNIHTKWGVWPKGCAEMLDWLNAHQFDYHGLIPMGLALEAKEGMYK